MAMIWSKGKRLPRILITFFTIFSLMLNFCLDAGEPLRDAGFGIEGTGGADGKVDNFIPSPVEEPALLTQPEDRQFMPLRTGFQRIFNFFGICGGASSFFQPAFMINSSISDIDVKNIIPLKLRI
jgi:hypothetical protein